MGWKKGKGHHQHAGGFQTSVSKGESSVGRRFRIRLYTEYLWENQMYDKISFQFSDGFAAQYQKWREGFRIRKDADRRNLGQWW